MKNKIYEEFSKDKFNQGENFNEIMLKVHNIEHKATYKFTNIAAIVIIMLLLGCATPEIYAKIKYNIEFKNFQNREYEMSCVNIKDVTERGLVEKIDMDYVVQDDIGVKIDSLYITDNHLEIKTNFVFPKDTEMDSEHFWFGYAIYDENSILYGILPRIHFNDLDNFTEYSKFLYKEIGIEIDENGVLPELQTYSTAPNIYAGNYNIISKIIMDTSYGFPHSKKLFIRIFDLGCLVYDENGTLCYDTDLQISNAEWIFELNIPEKFYIDDTTKLKLKDELQGVTINKLYVDDIKLRIDMNIDFIYSDNKSQFTIEELSEMITITDEDGKEYEQIQGSIDNNNIVRDFAINKNMLGKKYFLNIKIRDKVYTSELVIK